MNINFQGYIPVRYYAKDAESGKYLRIVSDEYIRKCQRKIISILNSETQKNELDESFFKFYRRLDKDHAAKQAAASIYPKTAQSYIVTGQDAVFLKDSAYKTVGAANHNSYNTVGHLDTFETKQASKMYQQNALSSLKHMSQVSNEQGNPLLLKLYFVPNYYKKGPNEGKLKSFTFVNAQSCDENLVKKQDAQIQKNKKLVS